MGPESPRGTGDTLRTRLPTTHAQTEAGSSCPPLPCPFRLPFWFGERARLFLTAVTATSCGAGEGEVRSKTSRTTVRTMGRALDMQQTCPHRPEPFRCAPAPRRPQPYGGYSRRGAFSSLVSSKPFRIFFFNHLYRVYFALSLADDFSKAV